MKKKANYYNNDYFDWQSSIGEFGGWANQSKFSQYVDETDTVLDFGCGGGYLLKHLACKKKYGVEINPVASEQAQKNGLTVAPSVADFKDNYFDVIISNHALEHTHRPLDELKSLYPKLKKDGKIIFVVPCESINYTYKPNDVNRHLYTWSPMDLGNLFDEAGFTVIDSKPYIHKWPPNYRTIARWGGRGLFEVACRVYGQIERSWFQVRIIATK